MKEMKSFDEMMRAIQKKPRKKTLVAIAPEEPNIISAIAQAKKERIISNVIFVGKVKLIRQIIFQYTLDLPKVTMINELDKTRAAQKAADLIVKNKAQMIMKGDISSDIVMSEVLNNPVLKKRRGKSFISHVLITEERERLFIFTDAGFNRTGCGEPVEAGWYIPEGAAFTPERAKRIDKGWFISENKEVEMKTRITENAIDVAHLLGIKLPKIAFVSKSNKVDLRSPSSVIAKKLSEIEWPEAVGYGPIDIDSALFPEAHNRKHLSSPISGEANVIVVPDIDAGNMIKNKLFSCQIIWAGALWGAGVSCPFASQASREESEFLSIVLAVYFDMAKNSE